MRNLNAAILPGLLLAAVPAWAAAADDSRSWHFTALLDGRRIGAHDFTVRRHGDEITVDSAAHFKVGLAFIPLYAYDHEDHETWRDGCLTSIASRTNDNGHQIFVRGTLQGAAFAVDSSRGARMLPACVRTFAYWDESLLSQPPLLNTQTGELQSVAVTFHGSETITVAGSTLAAKRYSLKAPHVAIELWYTGSGDWVALESRLDGGRTLRYAIQ